MGNVGASTGMQSSVACQPPVRQSPLLAGGKSGIRERIPKDRLPYYYPLLNPGRLH